MALRQLALLIAIASALLPLQAGAQSETPPAAWVREFPLTDWSRIDVDLDEIMSGGPPRDGIPAIDEPVFAAIGEGIEIPDQEPVLSVRHEGEARAYPLRILIWHEIVNDEIADDPIAVTYCPLCNSGIAFDRRFDGRVLDFGTTGRLRHSDLVMYDRQTETLWQQFDGTGLIGTYAGETLTRLPLRMESFAEFAAREPDGLVLQPPRDASRPYGRNPYAGYDSAARPFLYRGSYDGPGSPMSRVVAVGEEAWLLDFVREQGEIRHRDLRITWTPGQVSALDTTEIARGREVGTVTVERILQDGTAEPVIYDLPFAFAFRAFKPDAPIHGE